MANALVLDNVPETKFTRWHNPLNVPQRVVLEGPRGKFAFVVPPGETRELDSVFDKAIHQLDCGEEACHGKGWFCTKGHEGLVVGGLAPLLQREGFNDKLHDSLNPAIAQKKQLEATLAAEALISEGKQQAVVAARQLVEQQASEHSAPVSPPPGSPEPLRPNESKRR
jgi:hypothetical protein